MYVYSYMVILNSTLGIIASNQLCFYLFFFLIIAQLYSQLGRETQKRGFSSVGDMVRDNVKKNKSAAALVQLLVDAYPLTFNDVHTYNNQQVFLYKKAQLVTGMLYY